MPETTKRPRDYETLDDYFDALTIEEMFGLEEIDMAAGFELQRRRKTGEKFGEEYGRNSGGDYKDPQETIALAYITLKRVRELVSAIGDPSFQYETPDIKETIRMTINRTLNIITFGREGYERMLAERKATDDD